MKDNAYELQLRGEIEVKVRGLPAPPRLNLYGAVGVCVGDGWFKQPHCPARSARLGPGEAAYLHSHRCIFTKDLNVLTATHLTVADSASLTSALAYRLGYDQAGR